MNSFLRRSACGHIADADLLDRVMARIASNGTYRTIVARDVRGNVYAARDGSSATVELSITAGTLEMVGTYNKHACRQDVADDIACEAMAVAA